MSKYQDTQEDWEKEFDERWRFGENAPLTNHIADIKSFIKAEIADTRARVKAQAHAKGIEVGKAIGREEDVDNTNIAKRLPSDRVRAVANERAMELSVVSCYAGGLAVCQIEEIVRVLDELSEALKEKKEVKQ